LLKIVHQDIKPDNIMFSPIFKELVFIDYGVSKIIREVPGQRTLTRFVGTLDYCSPEMV
jgi:serine/threonine protein kinase